MPPPDAAARCLAGTCTWLYPGCPPPTVQRSLSRPLPLQGNLLTLLPSSWPVNPIRRARQTGMRLASRRARHHFGLAPVRRTYREYAPPITLSRPFFLGNNFFLSSALDSHVVILLLPL